MRAPALTALALLGCDPPVPDRAAQAVLPALGLSLVLPAGTAVYERPAGTWVLDLRPGMRSPRRVRLAITAPGNPVGAPTPDPSNPWTGPEAFRTGSGDGIAYFTRVGGGGSGGIEADLVGRWELPDRAIAVTCQVQEEPLLSEGPDPAFCLPLLAAARVIPLSDGPPVLGPDLSLGDPLRSLPQGASPGP